MGMKPKGLTTYEFEGFANVSVRCFVEAESEEEAMAMIENGDVTWECEYVDGDVDNIELMG
jgi:hypothetical protein